MSNKKAVILSFILAILIVAALIYTDIATASPASAVLASAARISYLR